MKIAEIEQEELHSDLKLYLEESRSFPMLRHPLVYSVPYFEGVNQMLNKQYAMKLKMIADYLQKSDWFGYVYAHERPYRLYAFCNLLKEYKISDSDYWELLGDIWIDSENIWSNKKEWKKLLSSNRPEREKFMKEEDREIFKNLPDKITAYRGYLPGKNKTGFSYSLNRERAEWFSKRFNTNGKVSEIEILKSKLFAYTDSRSEQEIIII
jgi:hypothetical protein